MKKLVTLVVAVMMALGLTACGSSTTTTPGQSGQASKGVIRAGATGQSFPNAFKEGDKLVGFDVELLEAAAKRAGYTVQWTNADFAGLMGQLEAGRLDTVANNVAITEARQKTYDFTDIYAYMGTSIAGKKGSAVTSLKDLDGKTVAGVLGSNNVKTLEAWAQKNGYKVTVRTYETRDGAMNDLINGRVDGYVQSSGILLAEAKKANLPIALVGDPIAADSIGLPFSKNEQGTKIRTDINAELVKMKADGSIKTLSEKYFGSDVTVKPTVAS